jgi:hypothetical protein
MTDQIGDDAPDAVARLTRGEAPFLDAHHVEAARRLARLFERSRLSQRVTMSYDPTRLGGRAGGSGREEISLSAADARKRLNDLAALFPSECWSVLFDVCGLDRGMQEIEVERDWPRRSGKLVLRIALSQLAAHYGLLPSATGPATGRGRTWLPDKPAMFSDASNS